MGWSFDRLSGSLGEPCESANSSSDGRREGCLPGRQGLERRYYSRRRVRSPV